jgi:hypothetical protein
LLKGLRKNEKNEENHKNPFCVSRGCRLFVLMIYSFSRERGSQTKAYIIITSPDGTLATQKEKPRKLPCEVQGQDGK